jgi:hypothetical protein
MVFDMPRLPQLTDGQKAAIVQRAQSGALPLRIAGELLLPLPLVLQHLELSGLRHRPKAAHISDEQPASSIAPQPVVMLKRVDEWPPDRIRRLIKLWRSGMSIGEIALKLGLSRNSVKGKLDRLGLRGRDRHEVERIW